VGSVIGARGFLTAAERAELSFAGRLETMKIATRFLADHLAGDHYFRIHRAGHNLDRCRAQLRLVESMEDQRALMEQLTEDRAARRRLVG